jgi:colicin import membrane protein
MNPTRPARAACFRWPALLAACALLAALPARAADSDDAERSRIASERAAIEATFAARERECRERFVVTSCVDEARRERRRGLDALRARQLQLDEARRRERAAERRAELAAKAAEDARRDQERAARAASAPARRDAPQPLEPRHDESAKPARRAGSAHDQPGRPGQGLGLAPEHRESADERRAREASSRAGFEARQRQAAEHRQSVLERAAKRLKEHPPAAPLPEPPAPSAASR